ncbi:MAG: transglycosylase SLT domain-containing protein [Bdellovibrionales bacterium]
MVSNLSYINQLQQNTTASGAGRSRVYAAIKDASDRTGVDFSYLMNKAAQESNFNPEVKASGSSATGLYQFIEQTWLKTVKENGETYGLGDLADKITIKSNGVASVTNAADRQAILELRKDPEISALMAAELAKDNKAALEKKVGGDIGATEMYLAHFLGSGGASNFLNTMKSNPSAKAADVLPLAANANKSVFYDTSTGRAKSVSEVYQTFAQKFDKAPAMAESEIRLASAEQTGTVSMAVDQARSVEDQEAMRMTVATLLGTDSSSTVAASDTVSLSNGMTLNKATTSSPFATMVLAQMDMDTFGLDTAMDARDFVSKLSADTSEKRKSVLSTLADSA